MRLAFAALLLVGVARADDSGDARALYQKATNHFAVGDFARAADEYQQAYTLKPDPALLFNAAQAYRLAGNNEKALILYKNYAHLYPKQSNVPEVRTQIDKLEQAIAAAEQAKRSQPQTTVEMPAPAPSPAPTSLTRTETQTEKPPVYKKWWFWTAIVGAAAVAAVVIGVSVAYTQPQPHWNDVPNVGPGANMGIRF